MLEIKFIEHSSFLVETQDVYILFDYFRDGTPPFVLADSNKMLYIMNSHAHGDHYSSAIFDLPRRLNHDKTRFILSHDIKIKITDKIANMREKITSIAPHELVNFYNNGSFTIETLESNDAGVAFWCRVSGHEIYHAGDLNNWFWDGDDEDKDKTRLYHRELERIAGRTADAAFIPLDPRLDKIFPSEPYLQEFPVRMNSKTGFTQPVPSQITASALGIEDYMQYADAKKIYPMHMWGKFNLIDKFCALPEVALYRDKIIKLPVSGLK